MTPGEVSELPGRQERKGLERKQRREDVQINVIEHVKDVSSNNCDVYNLETAHDDGDEDSGDQMQKSPPKKDPQCLCC